MPSVSVIIPVYKVEKFIVRCVRSLMEQTLQDVEFIFVDDASPDGSIALLEDTLAEYPERASQTMILTHEANKGLPAARNTGLAKASGEYIYHCDSDDWVECDMLEKMYNAAKKNDADIVYCDFYISFEKNERYMSNPDYKTADELLKRGFLGGMAKYNVWNKLVRRSIYADNGITFPGGHNMGEDMTTIMLAACSERLKYIPEAYYHYVKLNAGAYSNTVSEKHLADIKFNMDRTISFLEARYGNALEREIAYFKLSNKLPFLISDDKEQYKRWAEWYPEANRYVMDNKDVPLRTRLLQWMAAKKLFFGVKLYYIFIYKFVYGVIYR